MILICHAKVRNSEVEFQVPQKKRILAQQIFEDAFSIQFIDASGFTNREIVGAFQSQNKAVR